MEEEWENWSWGIDRHILEQVYRVIVRDEGYVWIDFFDKRNNLLYSEGIGYDAMAYRYTKISLRKRTVDKLKERHGKVFLQNMIFRVNHSAYIKNFSYDYYGVWLPEELSHYAIVSKKEIIDIIVTAKKRWEI